MANHCRDCSEDRERGNASTVLMGSTLMHASLLTKWIIGHWFGMSSSCLAGLSQGNITGSPGTEEPSTSTNRST
ncbi:hypothetical protein BDV40DRAFT_257626 [Aspergillus tamarii]|uniref:Uncharacterized protein n=1 Tax=Aspergillus tamarii TaxID=41984 RepID=A0A5N6V491_ASPTM|nr:hypothetical protein BDV40DRAFT_257626 [Aspergillus tamarii]